MRPAGSTTQASPVAGQEICPGSIGRSLLTAVSPIGNSLDVALAITHHSSLITHHSSFITHHSLLIIHYSSFITHHSLLITHYSLLITHYSSLITHYSSLITHHSSLSRRDILLPCDRCRRPGSPF